MERKNNHVLTYAFFIVLSINLVYFGGEKFVDQFNVEAQPVNYVDIHPMFLLQFGDQQINIPVEEMFQPKQAFAQSPPEDEFPLLLERGQNYSHTLNGIVGNLLNITTVNGLPDYILGDNGKYVPYILHENDTTFKIESNRGSMIFHKDGCNALLYPSGFINTTSDAPLITSESWIIHQRNLTSMDDWEYIDVVNNATCTNTIYKDNSIGEIILESNKTSANVATSSVKYIMSDLTSGFKVLTQVTNLNPLWTNNSMGFIETLHVPDTVTLNGTDYHIPSNNGTFFDHDFFNDTKGAPVMLGDNTYYYTDDGLTNLWGATLHYIDGQSKITFDYSYNDNATDVGDYYEIDPTLDTEEAFTFGIKTFGTVSSSCSGTAALGDSNAIIFTGASGASSNCISTAWEFDLTAIPDNIDSVTDSFLNMSVVGTSGGGLNCDVVPMEDGQPSTRSDAQLLADVRGGNDYITNDNLCSGIGDGKVFDLGSTGDSDIFTAVSGGQDWFGVGVTPNPYSRSGSTVSSNIADDTQPFGHPARLQIEYLVSEFTVNIPSTTGNLTIQTNGVTGNNCGPTKSKFFQPGLHQILTRDQSSSFTPSCEIQIHEFDTSSLPTNQYVTILNTTITHDFNFVASPPVCDYHGITVQPSVESNATLIWEDAFDGPIYADDTTECQSAGGLKTIDLGPTADSDLEEDVNSGIDYFSVSTVFDNMGRGGSNKLSRGSIDTAVLGVTFSVGQGPPPAPHNIDATVNRDGKVKLTWDISNGTGITGYSIFRADNYTGPFELLDTVGNTTSYNHINLPDNFESYYKVSAFVNPNGTNSTIVFGQSGNPFINDTSNIATQNLWVDDSAFIIHKPGHTGTGANCPSISGPSSASNYADSASIKHYDQSDSDGCHFQTWTLDRTVSDQMLPLFFNDYLSGMDSIQDQDTVSTFASDCRLHAVSDALGRNIDPRLNITAAYEVIQDFTQDETITGSYGRCSNGGLLPELESHSVVDYLNSMGFNSSFYSFGVDTLSFERQSSGTFDENSRAQEFMRYEFTNPTFSKIWNIQEHPKFNDNSLTEGKAKETFDGKLNLNTFSDNSDKGQIVIFKEFNATQVGGLGYNTDKILTDLAQAELDAIQVSAQEAAPEDVFFSPNGTKMYIVGFSGDDVNEYNLGTAWDITSRSFVQSESVVADAPNPSGVYFKDDGLKMYIASNTDKNIVEYDLTNPFDVSSASYLQEFNTKGETSNQSVRGIYINNDGSKLYIPHSTAQNVTEWDFGTAFDTSTLSFNQYLDVSTDIVDARDVWFDITGEFMFVLEEEVTDRVVNTYQLSVPYDISTATWIREKNLQVIVINNMKGIFFRDDGLKMYALTDQAERLLQYDLAINQTGTSVEPNIRVTGTYQTNAVTDDVNLRFEIKDGSYAMGSDVYFPQNEYDIYNSGGSLGVAHLSPSGTGVESFDITLTPNWSNSTSDIFTVFVGIDDNSTSSNLSVNVTNFYIANTLAQDFEDLGYVQFNEVASTESLSGISSGAAENGLEANTYYNQGLVFAEQIDNIFVDDVILTAPVIPTNANVTGIFDTALTIEWDHNLINTTDFIISRESPIGGGFVKLSDTNNVTKVYEDTGLMQGTQYNYQICGVNGESVGSCTTTSAFTSGLPFDPPSNLQASNNLLTTIELSWTPENATGVTGYTIYNSSTGSAPFDILTSLSDNSTMYDDINLPNDFDMYYKVSAFGIGKTNGTNSTVAMGSTIPPGTPNTITSVNAVADIGNVFLEWFDSGINITSYQIERNGTLITTIEGFQGWNLTGATLNNDQSFNGQDTDPHDILFSPNGSKAYTVGNDGDDINEYDLGTAWDQTTRVFVDSLAVGTTSPTGAFFKPDGLKLFVSESGGGGQIREFELTNPFDVSTGTFVRSNTTSGVSVQDLFFKPDGTKLFIVDGIGQTVKEFNVTKAWELTNVDVVQSLDISTNVNAGNGIFFKPDGQTMYIANTEPFDDTIETYLLSTAWDISTAVHDNSFNTETPTTLTINEGLFIKPDGLQVFITGNNGRVYDFNLIQQEVNLTKSYIDQTVSLGTHYIYNVSGVYSPNGTGITFGPGTLSNVVKTNNLPSQVQNLVADLANFFSLNQIELSWTQANNGTGNPLGVGVSLLESRVYSKNITDGDDFILTATLPATSPPPTEYNDTNIIVPNDYSYMVSSCNILGCGPNSTEIFADSIDFPDAIFDFNFYDLAFDSLILNWTAPFLGGGSLQDGYNINFTTPHAEPLTILVADTESAFTEYSVTGLTELTNYSFRVTAINQAGVNATGLILNVTTLDDFTQENFTVGEIGEPDDEAVNATNTDVIPIMFERIDIDDTTVRLNVTYANNIDLACEFGYKFAMTESFFDSPLNITDIGGGKVETSFLFLDFENEVVDVFCWNEVNNQSASYILVQQNFPLLEQIADFRAGEFGTEGMFGILDLITLMVIILSMIGFNRVNETVGGIFNIIFIGALSFFGIIELHTTIFAAVALVLMLIIITTRKV